VRNSVPPIVRVWRWGIALIAAVGLFGACPVLTGTYHSLLPGVLPSTRDPGISGPDHHRESVAGASSPVEAAGSAHHRRSALGLQEAGQRAAGAADPDQIGRGRAALFAL
jgi:hypothetical protein